MKRELANMEHQLETQSLENMKKFVDLGAEVRAEFIKYAGWDNSGTKMHLRSKFTTELPKEIIRPHNDPFVFKVLVLFSVVERACWELVFGDFLGLFNRFCN